MPQTVPKSPMKGEIAPVVARKVPDGDGEGGAAVLRARRGRGLAEGRLAKQLVPVGGVGHVGLGPLDGPEASNPRFARVLTHHHLVLNFAVATQKDAGQRAALESFRRGPNLRKLLAAAENLEELVRLAARGLEASMLAKDDRPGNDGEKEKQDQNESRHRPGVRNQLPNFILQKDANPGAQPTSSLPRTPTPPLRST